METFETSRGIGRELELFGIKSSSILVLAAGIAIGILLYFIISISGTNTFISIVVAIIWCTGFAVGVLITNRRMGENGLTKYFARKRIPSGIRNGVRSYNLIRHNMQRR